MTQMEAIIQAVNAVMSAQGGKTKVQTKGKYASKKNARKPKGRQTLTDAEKAVFAAKNDADCITAFAAKGIQDIKPRENVLTYGKWFDKGFVVKKGEKAVRVGPFNLFHSSQVEPAPAVIGA